MIVLWFFQVFFLNSFYGVMKDEQTRSVARDIESSYERKSSEKFLEAVESISTTNDMLYTWSPRTAKPCISDLQATAP